MNQSYFLGGNTCRGARPASRYNYRQQKACVNRRLPSAARFFVIYGFTKNEADEAQSRKSMMDFLDKLNRRIGSNRCGVDSIKRDFDIVSSR